MTRSGWGWEEKESTVNIERGLTKKVITNIKVDELKILLVCNFFLICPFI